MTRSELVEAVYRRHGGISRQEAQELLNLILNLIKSHLAAGERVEIAGFGSFRVAGSAARVRRHPVTGRPARTPGGRTLEFRPSPVLSRSLNSRHEEGR